MSPNLCGPHRNSGATSLCRRPIGSRFMPRRQWQSADVLQSVGRQVGCRGYRQFWSGQVWHARLARCLHTGGSVYGVDTTEYVLSVAREHILRYNWSDNFKNFYLYLIYLFSNPQFVECSNVHLMFIKIRYFTVTANTHSVTQHVFRTLDKGIKSIICRNWIYNIRLCVGTPRLFASARARVCMSSESSFLRIRASFLDYATQTAHMQQSSPSSSPSLSSTKKGWWDCVRKYALPRMIVRFTVLCSVEVAIFRNAMLHVRKSIANTITSQFYNRTQPPETETRRVQAIIINVHINTSHHAVHAFPIRLPLAGAQEM